MEYKTKHHLLECLDTQKDFLLAQPFEYKSEKRNELLFFMKPGFFLLDTFSHRKEVLRLVLQKLEEFDIELSGAALVNGAILDQAQIMDRHYGYINKVSKNASKMIGPEELEGFHLMMPDFHEDHALILGGHEFLERYPSYNAQSLNALWMTHPSHKLRSGFYYHDYLVDGQYVVLVNGFHPSQLFHFTDPEHKILVGLLHSDADWRSLKENFAGDTYPRKADPNSIRGTLFHEQDKYGTQHIGIANNFIHLSAGPFEGFFELENFLSNIGDVHFHLEDTRLAMVMREKGLGMDDYHAVLSNPEAVVDGNETDLFTYTENFNSRDAVDTYIKYFKK